MDIYRIIGDLVEERNRLERIIQSLESALGNDQAIRPKSRRGRKSMDGPARREVSERMKKYWARRREERSGMVREIARPAATGAQDQFAACVSAAAEAAAMTNVASA